MSTRFGYIRGGVTSINGETGDIQLNLQRVQQQVRYFTLTSAQGLSKSITLPIAPTSADQVQVDVLDGGGALYLHLDFSVNGSVVSWDGGRYSNLITEGDTLRIRWTSDAGTQQQIVRYYTLDQTHEITRTILLPTLPGEPERVVVDVMNGGGTLVYGVDFSIVGQTLTWNGGRLSGLLGVADELRVAYY